ncbi:MAG: hypothetical protein EBR02_09965, partial [Alphaproteobacteria bacterium]|nr:hypothetical protein [Alphaproteobacteria bacterium]
GKIQAETEQAEVDRQLTEKTDAFIAAITPLFFDYRELSLTIRREMPKIALAVAEKMLAHALSEEAAGVVEEIALRCCDQMAGEPRLTITVHESLADTLKHKLKAIVAQQQEPMQILVASNPDMPKADCRVEWANGSMERSSEKLWQNIQQVIDNMSIASARDTEEQLSFLQGNMAITAPIPVKTEEPAIETPHTETSEPTEQKE